MRKVGVAGQVFGLMPYFCPNSARRTGKPTQANTVQRKSRTVPARMPTITHSPRLPCSTAERVGGTYVNGKSGAADLALKEMLNRIEL